MLFNFAGYLVPNGAGLVLAYVFPTDIISLYAVTAVILGALSIAALLVLACCIQERPAARTGTGNMVPPVVALRRALNVHAGKRRRAVRISNRRARPHLGHL